MARYAQIDTAAFEKFLLEKGFLRTVQSNEAVYIRRHHMNPYVVVKVYTSIADRQENARACGEDAIRVVAVFQRGQRGEPGYKSFGIHKCARTYRTTSTESVIERVYARMREAYDAANQWVKKNGVR